MNRKALAIKCIKAAFIGIVLLLLYAPILLLAVYSFIGTDVIGTSGEFSFEHYTALFTDSQVLTMIGNTLGLAFASAALSTVLGTLGALGMYYSKRRVKTAMGAISRIPIINAEIVTALSLAIMFVVFGLPKSYFTLLMGHMVICTPFVVLSVMPKLKQMDNSLYEAALDLGATPTRALFTVIVPQILPGIVSGFLLAVTLSLDDYVIDAYTKPGTFQTISTHIYGLTKGKNVAEIKASYWAFTAVIFAIIVIVLITTNIISYKKTRSKQQ